MERQIVQSTNLSSAGYDPDQQVLEIAFKSSRVGQPEAVYQYKGVPERVFKDLLGAQSKGTYFRQHIQGKYDFQRV